MNQDEFREQIKELGLTVTEEIDHQLQQFYQLLIEWNEKMNLTRITEKNDVYLKHFYDSLTLFYLCDFNQISTLCDVGSGAGFPGIVLKIFFPNLEITLIDSLQKRVNYLNEIIKKLGLKKIVAVHARAEDYARTHYEQYDVVTARAVAHLRILSELCIPMVKTHGFFLVMKGTIEEELEESIPVISMLSSKIVDRKQFLLPIENSTRNLVKIEKLVPTKKIYPRTMDKIKKITLNKPLEK